MRFTGKEQYVRAFFPNALKCLRGSGNCRVDDNRLHERVVRKSGNLCDGCFLLGHKIIRIGDMLNHTAGFNRPVHFDQFFGAAKVIF